MSSALPPTSDDVFDLSSGGPSVLLEESGFRLRTRSGHRRARLTPYAEITHVDASSRGLWLGLRRTVVFVRRHRFRSADGPERLARALERKIASQPGGLLQLGRMAEVDHLAAAASPRRAALGVALLCLAVYVLQLQDVFAYEVGAFIPELVVRGEPWRVITANFLHGFVALPVHLGLNLFGLMVLAQLVERPLGPLPTVVVLGASAVAAMGASALAGYAEVVGASGMVAGLAGAALCLELHFPERLPARWRVPRRLYLVALIAEGVYGALVPMIAGAAHLGGFAAAYVVTRWLAARALSRRPAARWVRTSAIALGVATLLSFGSAAPLVLRDGSALARHGRVLLAAPGLRASSYNDLAWRMVTEAELDREDQRVAVELATRAVRDTGRGDPDVLDTLAEALFAGGDAGAAIDTIDEAIALVPDERYFREQRRRFTGDRAADDRPDAPRFPRSRRAPPRLPLELDRESGVEI